MDGRQRVIWKYDVGVDIKVNPRTSPLKIKSSNESSQDYFDLFYTFRIQADEIIQIEHDSLLDLWYLERC